MNVTIVKGRDANITIRIIDKYDDPVDLTDWTLIKARLLKEDDDVLEKLAPLTAAVNEIQQLDFSEVPDSGQFKLSLLDKETTFLNSGSTNTDVQNALNALNGVSGLTVTGDFTAGFEITFAGGSGGRNWDLVTVLLNTLKKVAADVTITPSTTTSGVPENGVSVIDEKAGKIELALSEDDTTLLKTGSTRDLDLLVRIGARDLNIPPQKEVLDVREAPF